MKVIAFILATYFSLLMMQPLAHMSTSTHGKGCGNSCVKIKQQKACHHKKTQEQHSCNTDFCNPFVPCGLSIADNRLAYSFGKPVFHLSKQLTPATNDSIKSYYLADCWKPPKLT